MSQYSNSHYYIDNTSTEQSINMCSKHNRHREIVCITCQDIICTKCALFNHRDHNIKEIDETQAEIADNVERLMNIQNEISNLKNKVDEREWLPILIKRYTNSLDEKRDEILKLIDNLKIVLNKREHEIN